ncbi:arginase [[Clostridium] ultunense Esp]|uniref:arginase n=1 Tax=Thermicanus aegyptius TaxID=94009 RepID=UPI0002B706E1|nr:arginase [Thermicanus aegyptius]CCQ94396.1 arginase [[Clostridium] ultunense Esp]
MSKRIALIGVPMDLGADRRGVDMGPAAIRYAGLTRRLEALGYQVEDFGDLPVHHEPKIPSPEEKLKYKDEILSAAEDLASRVDGKIRDGYFPLIIGGDHSISIGSLAGIALHKKRLGVIWFDAHGDLNTAETTPSGNIHGMPLALALGIGDERLTNVGGYSPKVSPENVVIIGARDLDPGEKELIHRLKIRVFTMHEIDRMGMTYCMEEALKIVGKDTDGVHLSLDLDGIDPLYAPGVGTPVVGGITYRESHLAMEMLAESGLVTSVEFVEVNPILDVENKTAKVAVALAGSLFGEKLL